MRTLIKGGTVVTATETMAADVLVDGERVATVGSDLGAEADRIIDASGRLVTPGGIDVHTHMEMPFGGTFSSDDFATGTAAAAWGGTTTIVDFAVSDFGEPLQTAAQRWHEKAGPKAHIDYGFHMIVREVNEQTLADMDSLVDQGITSFKLFMAYPGVFMVDDASLFRAMSRSSENGALIMLHAENAGTAALAETCPQYLFLSADDLARPGFEGAKYVCSPPLRPKPHQAELWNGLRSDDLQLVATDHCPFHFKDQKQIGVGNFAKIPNGLPGVEDRYTLLYDGGVRGGQISLNRFVELVAAAPAKLFGLYPRKGTIAPGSDADIVVFDAETERVLSAATHHMNVDYSCYEGRSVRGVPEVVMQRGQVLVDHGKFLGHPGQGQFLSRSRSGM